MLARVSGTLLVGLILLTSLPDLQESRRGLGGTEDILGVAGDVQGVSGDILGVPPPPTPPHLDVGLGQGDHLGQDVSHLQVLQLVPLPCALP